jgi:hypothetical protein
VRWLSEKNEFKRRVRDVLAQFERHAAGVMPPEFQGARPASPLEHVTRRHVIDHMLMALGWNLDRMNEQMIEEARARGENTLFLDYLGVNPQTRVPRLIVEAKAWEKPMVAASSAGASQQGANVSNSPAGLLALALQHIKGGGSREDSPVTLEWTDWLTTLRDYVAGIQRQSQHVVGRVAIASGRWLVVFVAPETAFLKGGDVPAGSIQVYIGADLVERSSDIFEMLARVALGDDVPAIIRPSRLPAFLTAEHVSRAFRAVWVTRMKEGAHFQIRPQIILNIALVIERDDGVLLTVVDDQLPNKPIPHETKRLPEHIQDVATLSDRLIAQVNAELQTTLTLSAVASFPGFRARVSPLVGALPDNAVQSVALIKEWPPNPDEFLLVLGTDPHYLRERPEVDPCGFHEWSICRERGQGQGATPVTARSVEPAAFFYDGELHHCAHRVIHDRRRERCHIRPFEEYLCCRACTLQRYCWTDLDLAALPCGTRAPRNLAIPAEDELETVPDTT